MERNLIVREIDNLALVKQYDDPKDAQQPFSGGGEIFFSTDGTYLGQIETPAVTIGAKSFKAVVFVAAPQNIDDVKKHIHIANNPREDTIKQTAATRHLLFDNIARNTAMSLEEINVRATLATLKKAEAGRSNPPLDYNTWNGQEKFTTDTFQVNPDAYKNHPGKNPKTGSTAAGAYQFLKRYYSGQDFSPPEQDRVAVKMMTAKGLRAAKKGAIVSFKKIHSGTWTSLKVMNDSKIQGEFKKNFISELNGTSGIAAQAGDLLPN